MPPASWFFFGSVLKRHTNYLRRVDDVLGGEVDVLAVCESKLPVLA